MSTHPLFPMSSASAATLEGNSTRTFFLNGQCLGELGILEEQARELDRISVGANEWHPVLMGPTVYLFQYLKKAYQSFNSLEPQMRNLSILILGLHTTRSSISLFMQHDNP